MAEGFIMPKKTADQCYEQLRAKGYTGAVDMEAALNMTVAELIAGLLGVVNAQERRIVAMGEQIRAAERAARHKK